MQIITAVCDRGHNKGANNRMKAFFKKKRNRWILIIVVVILAVFFGGPALLRNMGGGQANMDDQYTMVAAANRDIVLTLSGTGTLKPADSYTVTTLNSGDVINAPFEEGDVVAKDSVLFEIDSSGVASNIETASISVSESERSYQRMLENLDDLSIKAEGSGTVITVDIELGDTVQAGQTVATIRDSKTMSVTMPFGSDDAAQLKVGQSAVVTVSGSFESLTGVISKISSIVDVLPGGMLVKQVTIDVINPGGLTQAHEATAVVGNLACYASGTFDYKDESVVIAKASGDVVKLGVAVGDVVADGKVLVKLDSTALEDQIDSARNALRRSEISLESQQDALDGYLINSPIGGTVIEKNYKAGDTLEAGKPLCTIFDLSYLTMTLFIDELDISRITAGQVVTITAEAVDGKIYEGIVTKVNINGVTSGGTTSYPVTVRIDETTGLLPGMNVDANIAIESRMDVLAIPIEAVLRGDKVLVKDSTDGQKGSEATSEGATTSEAATIDNEGAPEGYHYVYVTTGISDTDFIEIVTGLNLGEEVAIEKRVARDEFQFGPPREDVQEESGGTSSGGTEVEAP